MILRLAIATAILCHTSLLMAQPKMPDAGINSAMTKLFGRHNAFSAKAEVRMLDKSNRETVLMTIGFATLDGKTRADMDMGQMKGGQIPAEALPAMKQMGMDRITSIERPDLKVVYLIYPGLQAYVDMPLPKNEAAAVEKKYKIETSAIGKETIDGHPCVKNKVTLTDDEGKTQEAFTWNASDLKDFPVQLQMSEGETTVITRYKDILMEKPDAKQFDAPAGFAKHGDVQSLMQSAMQKMLGGRGLN